MASPNNLSVTSAEAAVLLSLMLWDKTPGNPANPLVGSAAYISIAAKLETLRTTDGSVALPTGKTGNVGS